MKVKNIIKVEAYFEAFLIIILISASLYLIQSFFLPIFLATIIVFFLYKPYKKLVSKTKSESISAIFILFLILTIILLPMFFLISNLITQTSSIVYSGIDLAKDINFDNCKYSFCNTLENNIKTFDISIDKTFTFLTNYISESASSIYDSLSTIFMNLFIFILSFFFLLRDGDKFIYYIKKIIPMKDEYKRALFLRFKDVSEAVFIDSILVAIIQGTLLGIIFTILGIKSALFWGVIASFFSLLPMIGAGFIWVPAVIYFFLISNYFSGIIMFFSGIFISLIDNLIRPFLLKKKISIHPFIIMLSIFGGLEAFGFFGIFLGPILISLLISVLQLYKLDFD